MLIYPLRRLHYMATFCSYLGAIFLPPSTSGLFLAYLTSRSMGNPAVYYVVQLYILKGKGLIRTTSELCCDTVSFFFFWGDHRGTLEQDFKEGKVVY